MKTCAIVLAGGSGTRMGAEINKIFLPVRGVPAIIRAIAPFTGLCAGITVVARADEVDLMRTVLKRFGLAGAVQNIVPGGDDRQASVACGLAALPSDAEAVLIHDGARAMVTEAIIRRVILSIQEHGSGVAAVPVTDTVKRTDANGRVTETLNREALRAMQTPQGFKTADLRMAHANAERDGFRATDDAALLEHAGMPVYLCEGSRENIKLTTAFDMLLADAILQAREEGEAT
ncbi:MAG TPA: 2-C-methyl-D-erythritol 4-phosphate cytidylyltransferase [Candidatus Limiplasma sp.]|nr:2-C-methyl-D-erythritol 4-phosphate cytidylyltransferase [Candidatus Limiplasma sp.]HPS81853.1 2-C-methyl-D-erythritol 4-phosphate cytidylyltransferase [Candidatus Limiplasma sp.]